VLLRRTHLTIFAGRGPGAPVRVDRAGCRAAYDDLMSKVDALRALREAKYAATRSRTKPTTAARASSESGPAPTAVPAPVPAARRRAPASKARARLAVVPAVPAAPPSITDAELCGHRNMSGRSCTRPAEHVEKSHRYG